MNNAQLPLFESEASQVETTFSQDSQIVLAQDDTAHFLKTLPAGSVSLIITSPPYNIGKQYEVRQSLKQYLQQQANVIEELVRVLHERGSICWQVGNYVQDGEVYPLDIYYYDLFKEHGLKLRNRIVWHFRHGLHASKRFSGRYETILWFTKGDDYTFNLDDVRVPSQYPGKRHFKGPNKGKLSGNPLGKNPSDLWEFIAQEWDEELWDIPNVKSNHPEKTEHPCQFPIELVERCVLALTHEGDWVLDPYCGVGSSLIAGMRHNRRVMGCDKEEDYIGIARDRIQAFYEGRLKIRPLGKPVHQPTGREKVAQVPDEWKG
ncbi:MAG: site-specific DNA-methyltransferase [Anaerolineae bacterium]|nr:site-specific DNA-methyltransferase [Anaerolineae bacterium]